MNNNNYTLFERKNPEIAVIVFHVGADIESFNHLRKKVSFIFVYISQSNNLMCLNVIMLEKIKLFLNRYESRK